VSTPLALPLFVAALQLILAVAALVSGWSHRPQQLFAALAGVLGLAALGVFQIRQAADAAGGLLGQQLLNITFALTPAVYYHLVRVVTGTAAAGRRAIGMAYTGAAVFTVVALAALPLLVRDVVRTPRDWAPVTGPLGPVLFAFYLAVLAATLRPLRGAHRAALVAASLVMLLAPLLNFAAVLLARTGGGRGQLPSLRMPTSVVFIALVWFATRKDAT
jgi:hypothetical protein